MLRLGRHVRPLARRPGLGGLLVAEKIDELGKLSKDALPPSLLFLVKGSSSARGCLFKEGRTPEAGQERS